MCACVYKSVSGDDVSLPKQTGLGFNSKRIKIFRVRDVLLAIRYSHRVNTEENKTRLAAIKQMNVESHDQKALQHRFSFTKTKIMQHSTTQTFIVYRQTIEVAQEKRRREARSLV